MRPEQIKIEVNQLELSEKLKLVEDIWDSISENNDALTLSEWQKKELDQRYKDYQSGELKLHNWQVVHQEIRSNLK